MTPETTSKTWAEAPAKPSSATTTKRLRWREAAAYFVALVLCLWILERILKLRHADLGVPLIYDGGDAMYYMMVIKAIITNGWYLYNPFLGAPHGMAMHDFPMPDNFSFLLVKLIGLFTSSFGWAMNIFALLTFPLTTWCTLYMLRRFGVSYAPAICASLLYSFTYYHLSRSEAHVTYAVYFPVPLMVMVMLWICTGEPSLFKGESNRLHWRNPKLLASVLICGLLAATGGAYYSFFALFLLPSAGVYTALRRRSWRPLLTACLLAVVTFGAFAANLAPNMLYFLKHGRVGVAERSPGEAESGGLKIAQLLVPVEGHRLKQFAQFKERYNYSPLVNENTDAALGIIGGSGFLVLLGWLLYRPKNGAHTEPIGAIPRVSELLSHLSLLNITAFLLGTIGGFGSLFAHLVSAQIRSYNRISVYVACFSFFTVALLLDAARQRYFQTGARRLAFYPLVVFLILFGVLDQSPKHPLPDNYAAAKANFESDAEFVGRIETTLPPGAMVFQLPVHSFPEGEAYDHFRGYLHSQKLRWSFGAMRDRTGDAWQRSITTRPLNEMVETIVAAGFSGIYLDREYYPDRGAQIEPELAALLGVQPLVSRNQRLVFFDMSDYRRKLEAAGLTAEAAARRERLLHPLLVFWRKEFYGMETSPTGSWHWSGPRGTIEVENTMPRARQVTLQMSVAGAREGNMEITSPLFTEKLRVTTAPIPITKSFSLPPGKHAIRITCDGRSAAAPRDPRVLVFRVDDFKLQEVE
jgi:hypothetical protein